MTRLLLGDDWHLRDTRDEYATNITFPTDLITALHAAGIIDNPYWGMNEYGVRWVADRDWIASRSITLQDHQTTADLVISRLDTVATVTVNGNLVLAADNAFRRHRVSLDGHLKPGRNDLEIRFKSPTREANARQDAQPYFIPYTQNYPVPNGNMLRKPQCDFGWDWNAALMPSGIYGDFHLDFDTDLVLGDVIVRQHHNDRAVRVEVTQAVTTGTPHSASASFCGQTVSGQLHDKMAKFSFDIANPELWWPAGQGEQTLHKLIIDIDGRTTSRRIGLRKLKLVSEPDDVGRSFMFQVNDRPVFAKGANWIPADALAGAVTPEAVRNLLQSAVDAHMNMIRVWGGGWYETDLFYDICDELGLLVWQDAMFSCSLYPADDAFLAEVHDEIVDNATRLQHHACLALWCGDNELIGALTWYEESIRDRDRYLVAYDRLNRVIEQAVKTVDADANWWPSSPSPGPLSFGDAWHDDSAGDMHFWSVWHEGRDFEHYRDVKPRFCSEFGFQSYPSLPVIRRFADPKDFNIAAPVMESHQKNDGGNARIAETMFRYFRFPVSFEDFVYLSQVQQGLAIHTAVSYWRSLKPHCMGSLIWQLNDTWPVCSWASLDHGGGWKLLHYMARRFFAPISVSAMPILSGSAVSDFALTAINDDMQDVNLQLTTEAISCSGQRRLLAENTVPVSNDAAMPILNIGPIDANEVLYFRWQTDHGITGSEHCAPGRYKTLPLQDPRITMEISTEDTGHRISLTAERPAFFVAVESSCPGRFSDNGFFLPPGERRDLWFTAEDGAEDASAAPNFQLRHLYSATHAGGGKTPE